MTIMTASPAIKGETNEREAKLNDAVLEYFIGLSGIVDVHHVRALHEDPEFDLEASVPHEQLYEVTELLADLSFRVSETYGIKIVTLAVPT